MDNPLRGPKNPARMQSQIVGEVSNLPFEERVPWGTPDWALYGSLPARAATHVLARPVLDAMQHVHDVGAGKVDPWADLGPTGAMAGLVAGGGFLPGKKGVVRSGFPGWDDQLKKLIAESQPKLKPFGEQEFMTHEGEWANSLANPHHLAAIVLEHGGGDKDFATELLVDEIKRMEKYGWQEVEPFHKALWELHNNQDLPKLHALSDAEIGYVNSFPENSEINPYKALAEFKTGKISELPSPAKSALEDWDYGSDLTWNDLESEMDFLKDIPDMPPVVHPLDKKVFSPSVIRRGIPQAIIPYNWEMSSNASPQARAFNINHPFGHWMLDDPRLAQDALDMGFNIAHPVFKGMDPSKWVVPEVPWEASMTNPVNREASRGPHGLAPTSVDLFGEAFSHPGPGRGKERENALFAADTPIVSNEYTKHWGGEERGAQNVLGWLRSQKAGQVYWPEINHGYPRYDTTMMDNLINEMLHQDYDLMAIHGINDLGGTHTQYAWANPEQFRAIGAQFNPEYKDFPNMLLTQGSPFALQFKEPQDDRSNPLTGKGRTRAQTGR